MAVKQTAGRTALGEFAPKFAELNDDVLFGQVWSREDKLSLKERSLITVVALLSQGLTDTSFVHHLESAKANGITKSEIAEIITHAAFYAGWPKAWAAFRLAKDIWKEDANEADEKTAYEKIYAVPNRTAKRYLCTVFCGTKLSCPCFKRTGGHFQCNF